MKNLQPVSLALFLLVVAAVEGLPGLAAERPEAAVKPEAEEKPQFVLTPEIIGKVKEFHGHSCPGSYLGLRAAEWAMREFKTDDTERIVVVVEVPFCGVDSLQVILGCTTGSGNMIIKDYGKHAFNFYRPRDGKRARLLKKNTESPELREKLDALDPKDRMARNRVMQDYILVAPFEELFVVMEPKEEMPDTSRAKQDAPCSVCGEGVDVTRIKEKDGKKICPACLKDK